MYKFEGAPCSSHYRIYNLTKMCFVLHTLAGKGIYDFTKVCHFRHTDLRLHEVEFSTLPDVHMSGIISVAVRS